MGVKELEKVVKNYFDENGFPKSRNPEEVFISIKYLILIFSLYIYTGEMTIYALSSGPGVSGVAIIRISGPDSSTVVKSLTGKEMPKPRMATLTKINNINTSELIDEGIIIWFPGPESYTGEDMAELHIHGSKAVIGAIHKVLGDISECRIAEPGEFTKRAFQNGKINLLKAESISDLISSETEIQRKQAINIMTGKSSEVYNDLRDRLIKALSNIEAKIDFPEEEIPEKIISEIKKITPVSSLRTKYPF